MMTLLYWPQRSTPGPADRPPHRAAAPRARRTGAGHRRPSPRPGRWRGRAPPPRALRGAAAAVGADDLLTRPAGRAPPRSVEALAEDDLRARRAHRAPDPLGRGGHLDMANAERREGVDQRVADRRQRADRAGLAGALDAERVGPGRHRMVLLPDRRQIIGPRQRIIHERAGEQLPRNGIEADVFEKRLPQPLGDAAGDLAFEQQRV